ncbi:MAG: asparaginase [Chitinophagales bacterium]|nr:asparaginase [Chitinophagales bacterium]
MKIKVFVTGGTFDKEYDMINGKLYFKDTHLPEIFALGRCNLDINIRTLMMIDSLDMTSEDRELIVRQCKRSKEDKILITHGTDTMVKTAMELASEGIDKTIILTGAMIPYKFGSSDGFFNLGSALAFVQVLEPGVYVVMNGRYFRWNNVRKNRKTGYFEEISQTNETLI